MGLTGAMVAWILYQHGYTFTWEDNDQSVCAWKASTGLIYPCGDDGEMKAYSIWKQWHGGRASWSGCQVIEKCVEAGSFWFVTKNPPHGGTYSIERSIGLLHLASLSSYHLNVQHFVRQTRQIFSACRKDRSHGQIIIANGYGSRLHHYLWGWSARVHLSFSQDLLNASPLRPTFYLRRSRYQFGYANIIPGESVYYAGSSLIHQAEPKSLNIDSKYERWKQHVFDTTGGKICVTGVLDRQEGWRPVSDKQDLAWITQENGMLIVRPMGSSGVRLAPLLCEALLKILG
jgi:hypothetical protein